MRIRVMKSLTYRQGIHVWDFLLFEQWNYQADFSLEEEHISQHKHEDKGHKLHQHFISQLMTSKDSKDNKC